MPFVLSGEDHLDVLPALKDGEDVKERLDGTGARWYNRGMKTAISLPDELFRSADELAAQQGVSRSKLYATAVSEYLAKHRDEDVASKLNEVHADESSGLDPALRAAQARSVGSSNW